MANTMRLISMIQLSLYSTLVSSNTAPATHINSICPKSSNPPFCTSALKAAGTTDLKGLATYAIGLAQTNAAKSQTLAKSLSVAAANPQLKEIYSSCGLNYDEALDDFQHVQKHLASGDFKGINVIVSGIMTMINDCRDSFVQPDTSSLSNDGKTLNDICSIILVISNLVPTPV